MRKTESLIKEVEDIKEKHENYRTEKYNNKKKIFENSVN